MSHSADLDRKVLAAVERLGRALRAARQDVATRHEVSLLGLSVIETLADGRPRRVGDLAAELDVSQPTVSDAVTVLDKRGLIRRDRDPADLRSTLVALTDDGDRLAADAAAELAPLLAAGSGTDADRATTLRVLLGEIARLQAAGVITVNRSCLSCRHYQPPGPRTRARCLLLATALGGPGPACRLPRTRTDPGLKRARVDRRPGHITATTDMTTRNSTTPIISSAAASGGCDGASPTGGRRRRGSSGRGVGESLFMLFGGGGVTGETSCHGPGEAATAPSCGLGHRSVPAAVEGLVENFDPQLEEVVVEWFGVVQPPVRLDGLDRTLVRFAEQHRRPEVGEVEGVTCPLYGSDASERRPSRRRPVQAGVIRRGLLR